MGQRTFIRVAGVVFSVVGVVHLLRLVLKWDVVVGGWAVPTWFSCLGLTVAAFLAYTAFKLGK